MPRSNEYLDRLRRGLEAPLKPGTAGALALRWLGPRATVQDINTLSILICDAARDRFSQFVADHGQTVFLTFTRADGTGLVIPLRGGTLPRVVERVRQ